MKVQADYSHARAHIHYNDKYVINTDHVIDHLFP